MSGLTRAGVEKFTSTMSSSVKIDEVFCGGGVSIGRFISSQVKIKNRPTTPIKINQVVLLFIEKPHWRSDPHACKKNAKVKLNTTGTVYSNWPRPGGRPRRKHGFRRFCNANLALSRRTLHQDKVKP